MQDYQEFADELEFEEEFENEYEYEGEFEYEDDGEDEELAYELLAVENEEELDQFLGSIFRKVASGARRLWNSKIGRKARSYLGGQIKSYGRKMIPTLGRKAGRYLGARYGGRHGGRYGGRAGHNVGRWVVDKLGWELEMLHPEEQELEVAKKLVKIAKIAAKKTAKAAGSGHPPSKAVVKAAVRSAARQVLKKGAIKKHGGSRHSGRWVRKGTKIVVLGA
ncbi:MAG: hypothetical protein MI974_00930 [Chitinophagales bacterium]|nr:hypothetical protein [Chitinophagales bacterium]